MLEAQQYKRTGLGWCWRPGVYKLQHAETETGAQVTASARLVLQVQVEGELFLCDGEDCPLAAHARCISLNQIPEGEWFCRFCSASYVTVEKRITNEDGVPRYPVQWKKPRLREDLQEEAVCRRTRGVPLEATIRYIVEWKPDAKTGFFTRHSDARRGGVVIVSACSPFCDAPWQGKANDSYTSAPTQCLPTRCSLHRLVHQWWRR